MRIGYCVGVFDVLHYGHKNILTKCYEKSDILIVGIHTDKFVQSYKRKPRESEETRLKKVQTFLNLDKNHIHLIDDDHIQLIRKFNVNIIYHGNDWEIEDYKKQIRYYQDGMDKLGVNIELINYTKGISTSDIIKNQCKDLRHKKCFLFDLDDTLIVNNKAKLFAPDIINKLKDLNKDYYVVTNNNRYSPKSIHNILEENGIFIDTEKILSSLKIIKDFLLENNYKKVYIWGTDEAVSYLNSFDISQDIENPQLIVVLYKNNWNYQDLVTLCNKVCKYPYIIGNIDLKYPCKIDLLPDTGSIYNLLQNITQKQPILISGKPNNSMLKPIKKIYENKDIIFIGDSLLTDKALCYNNNIDFIHIADNGDISNLGVLCDYLEKK